jgi:hypothetical protein
MARPDQIPFPPGPARHEPGGPPGAGRRVAGAVIVAAAVIAVTALLGVATGFLWGAVAPRALVVVISHGSADVVNTETDAFIAADGWFALLTVAAGVLSGAAGWVLAVRRKGAPAMAGILVGGLAAALIAKWIGQQSGSAAFNHSLAVAQPGVLLHYPPTVGGLGALMFWPIAAGVVAGGIESIIALAERRRRWRPALAAVPASAAPASAPGRPVPDAPGDDPRG